MTTRIFRFYLHSRMDIQCMMEDGGIMVELGMRIIIAGGI